MPAECFSVSFSAPSSGVATVKVRAFFVRKAAVCVVVVAACHGAVTSCSAAVSAAPTWLLIETLLIASNAIPTNVMQSIALTDRFDYVR